MFVVINECDNPHHFRSAFLPYMEEVFTVLKTLLEYPASNIKSSAGKAITQLACAMAKLAQASPDKNAGKGGFENGRSFVRICSETYILPY